MSLGKTRFSTVVYFNCISEDPTFTERDIHKQDTFELRLAKSDSKKPMKQVLEQLKDLISWSQLSKQTPGAPTTPRVRAHRLPRDELVNRKRRMVAACIKNQTVLNLKAVARSTKSDPAMVKRVHEDIKRLGEPAIYTYNNPKDQQDLAALEADCRDMPNACYTVTDLKRDHPSFSKKFIRRTLRSPDRRWRKLPVEKMSRFGPPKSKEVCAVVSHVVQVLAGEGTNMMYLDEMKFPLHQASMHRWTLKSETDLTYSKREAQDAGITAIALCDTSSFVAVQLFTREVTGSDFVYFLNTVIPRLPTDRQVSILADNASWHKSSAVSKSKGWKYLFFNVPHMFQLNLIENAFSAVRNEFRRRAAVDTVEAEARMIVNMFFDRKNIDRFAGYYRNHLRMLEKYGKLHSNGAGDENL